MSGRLAFFLLLFSLQNCSQAAVLSAYNECSPGCPNTLVGDGQCQFNCLTPGCNYDLGDCCPEVPEKCVIGDFTCEERCLTDLCMFDYGDCLDVFDENLTSVSNDDLPQCLIVSFEQCSLSLFNNSECNDECDFAECQGDKIRCFSNPLAVTAASIFASGCFCFLCFYWVASIADDKHRSNDNNQNDLSVISSSARSGNGASLVDDVPIAIPSPATGSTRDVPLASEENLQVGSTRDAMELSPLERDLAERGFLGYSLKTAAFAQTNEHDREAP